MPRADPLVLDTHAWLWAAEGKVSARVAKRIDRAGAADELYVAAITPWEVAMAARAGRIRIRSGVLQWIEEALERMRVAVAPMDPTIAVDAVDLPGWQHGDPADRLIVATARRLDAVLVTADTAILTYAAQAHSVRVIEPR
jgi:PIN domain nuclease of toxin-antitoxin system